MLFVVIPPLPPNKREYTYLFLGKELDQVDRSNQQSGSIEIALTQTIILYTTGYTNGQGI